MRNISVIRLADEDFSWNFEPRTSGITDLTLEDSAVTAASLSGFLRGIKALRSFRYKATVVEFEFMHWHPRGIITSLLENAKDSLEELDLGHNDRFYSTWAVAYRMPMGSLRGFGNLKHVKVDTPMLFDKNPNGEREQGNEQADEQEDDQGFGLILDDGELYNDDIACSQPIPLMNILPASVETLKLVGQLNDNDGELLFSNMQTLRTERLPKLQKVTFNGAIPLCKETRVICKELGITLRSS